MMEGADSSKSDLSGRINAFNEHQLNVWQVFLNKEKKKKERERECVFQTCLHLCLLMSENLEALGGSLELSIGGRRCYNSELMACLQLQVRQQHSV